MAENTEKANMAENTEKANMAENTEKADMAVSQTTMSFANPKACGVGGIVFGVVILVPSYVLFFMEDIGVVKDEVDSRGVAYEVTFKLLLNPD
ncbi:hypothetical protein EDB89DRAFT_2067013 [Lactarius sanguifluus]|nr:hypothetical protein EDB89DRAFT_2067013 [Lactarius sanguifluus]